VVSGGPRKLQYARWLITVVVIHEEEDEIVRKCPIG
jgi:hypothetical protein